MGNNERYQQPKPVKKEIHPVWRGIGCLMMILIPVMAYAAADLVMQMGPEKGWFPYSPEIYNNIQWKFISLPFSLGIVLFTLFFTVFGFVVFSLVYAVIYRVAGPPHYGPTDSPPIRKKKKKRR